MVSVTPHAPAPTEDAIDRLRDPDRQALDAAANPRGIIALDEQVQVIPLHAEVKYTEAASRRSGKHGANSTKRLPVA